MRTLRICKLFNDARHMLIAVESAEYIQYKGNGNCCWHGNVVPVAVIVSNPDGSYALDMNANPTTVEQLKKILPGLDSVLATFYTAHNRVLSNLVSHVGQNR